MPVEVEVRPSHVVLVASDDPQQNLSGDAWNAWNEPPVSVEVSLFSGKMKTALAATGQTILIDRGIENEIEIATTPHPRIHKPATNVTLKERLDRDQIEEMLNDPADWELAVPNGTGTDVLTKTALQDAYDTKATGTVTMALVAISAGQKAVLDKALDSLTPKAGAARVVTALGVPVSSISLLATAALGLVGWKSDLDIPRPALLVAAGFLGLVALILSLTNTVALRTDSVQLSRIDLLRSTRSGPPTWMAWLTGLLFIAALVCAFFSVLPPAGKAGPQASFGQPTPVKVGTQARVSFTVSWKNLTTDTAKVSIAVSVPNQRVRTVTPPKQSDGTVSQPIAVRVNTPTRITVDTQPLDSADNKIGTPATHNYDVK